MAGRIQYDLVDKASPLVADITALGPERAARVIAPAERELFRSRFFRLDSERPNEMGGKRTHFFGQAARSTHAVAGADGVTVSVNQVGLRQRVEGGTIRPTGGRKWLTLPARSESYGTRASEWSNLRFAFFRNDLAALVEAGSTDVSFGKRRRKDGSRAVTPGAERGGLVMFWLVKEVTQRGDATILPSPDEVLAAAAKAIRIYIDTRSRRAAALN